MKPYCKKIAYLYFHGCRLIHATTPVGGIIAGAGDLRPGIVLGRNSGENQLPIALVGRVWCKADAGNGAIEIGDLLTTSDIPGHAMKATDRERCHGAILGKALTSLDDDTGMIRVLVTLQ